MERQLALAVEMPRHTLRPGDRTHGSVYAWHHHLVLLAGNVDLVQGSVQVIQALAWALVVLLEECIIGEPTCPCEFAGLPDHETQVCQHIPDPRWVGLHHNGDICTGRYWIYRHRPT